MAAFCLNKMNLNVNKINVLCSLNVYIINDLIILDLCIVHPANKYKLEEETYRHHLPSDFGLFYILSTMQSEICNRGFGLLGNLSSGSWPFGDIAIGLLVYRGICYRGFGSSGNFVIGLLTYRGFVIGLMVIGLLAIGLMSYTRNLSNRVENSRKRTRLSWRHLPKVMTGCASVHGCDSWTTYIHSVCVC